MDSQDKPVERAAAGDIFVVGTDAYNARQRAKEIRVRIRGDAEIAAMNARAMAAMAAMSATPASRDAAFAAVYGRTPGKSTPPPQPPHGSLPINRPPTEQVVHKSPRTGRNKPCPCGSGKKFKQCCLAGQAAKPHRPPTPRIRGEAGNAVVCDGFDESLPYYHPHNREAINRQWAGEPTDAVLTSLGYPPAHIHAYRKTGMLYRSNTRPVRTAETEPWYTAVSEFCDRADTANGEPDATGDPSPT